MGNPQDSGLHDDNTGIVFLEDSDSDVNYECLRGKLAAKIYYKLLMGSDSGISHFEKSRVAKQAINDADIFIAELCDPDN